MGKHRALDAHSHSFDSHKANAHKADGHSADGHSAHDNKAHDHSAHSQSAPGHVRHGPGRHRCAEYGSDERDALPGNAADRGTPGRHRGEWNHHRKATGGHVEFASRGGRLDVPEMSDDPEAGGILRGDLGEPMPSTGNRSLTGERAAPASEPLGELANPLTGSDPVATGHVAVVHPLETAPKHYR